MIMLRKARIITLIHRSKRKKTGSWRSECLILFRKLVLWICLEGSIPKFLMGLVMVTTINPLRREASERSRWGFQILPLSCGGASVLRSKRRVECRLSYRIFSLSSPQKSASWSTFGDAILRRVSQNQELNVLFEGWEALRSHSSACWWSLHASALQLFRYRRNSRRRCQNCLEPNLQPATARSSSSRRIAARSTLF